MQSTTHFSDPQILAMHPSNVTTFLPTLLAHKFQNSIGSNITNFWPTLLAHNFQHSIKATSLIFGPNCWPPWFSHHGALFCQPPFLNTVTVHTNICIHIAKKYTQKTKNNQIWPKIHDPATSAASIQPWSNTRTLPTIQPYNYISVHLNHSHYQGHCHQLYWPTPFDNRAINLLSSSHTTTMETQNMNLINHPEHFITSSTFPHIAHISTSIHVIDNYDEYECNNPIFQILLVWHYLQQWWPWSPFNLTTACYMTSGQKTMLNGIQLHPQSLEILHVAKLHQSLLSAALCKILLPCPYFGFLNWVLCSYDFNDHFWDRDGLVWYHRCNLQVSQRIVPLDLFSSFNFALCILAFLKLLW